MVGRPAPVLGGREVDRQDELVVGGLRPVEQRGVGGRWVGRAGSSMRLEAVEHAHAAEASQRTGKASR
jgi:hypothetical protein